jgi:predicted DNA-binding helix-hairpin-helix protein
METVRAGLARGLFLSSAIKGTAVATMDRMLGTLERLRCKHGFNGFIHTKIIPGADDEQIIRAMQLSDRVSVNLEAPGRERLAVIAPDKARGTEPSAVMKLIAGQIGRKDLRCKSHTTQYVVGAAAEKDREILQSLWSGYRELRLGRGYFSAFQPVLGTPLEGVLPTPAAREHRLYQTDFLFRRYGFTLDDIVFDSDENLSLAEDPKTLWALGHPEFFPLEVNSAEEAALLRVPGIGPKAARLIVTFRRECSINDIDQLKKATVRWRIAAPYLLFNGRRRVEEERQLRFLW